MTTRGLADRLLALHRRGAVLLLPNAWDQGSARLLEAAGFEAIATTSSGFAATLGRLDGAVTRAEALVHCGLVAAATGVPVSADLENGWADDPDAVAETIAMAAATGLAGASIEDFTGRPDDPIYNLTLATERIAAAAGVAHSDGTRMVLTARAENHLHGRADLEDTIGRLKAYEAAGADVLYAPGLNSLDQVRQVVDAVDRPLNVLLLPGGPSVAELEAAGVKRISVGGAFAYAAMGALVAAAREFREGGTSEFFDGARIGSMAARAAFKD